MFQKELLLIKQICKKNACFLFHFWYTKDIGHKFEPHVCNDFHEILMMAYELQNVAILNVKGVHYVCFYGMLPEMLQLVF